jgi:hypothetical protein
VARVDDERGSLEGTPFRVHQRGAFAPFAVGQHVPCYASNNAALPHPAPVADAFSNSGNALPARAQVESPLSTLCRPVATVGTRYAPGHQRLPGDVRDRSVHARQADMPERIVGLFGVPGSKLVAASFSSRVRSGVVRRQLVSRIEVRELAYGALQRHLDHLLDRRASRLGYNFVASKATCFRHHVRHMEKGWLSLA